MRIKTVAMIILFNDQAMVEYLATADSLNAPRKCRFSNQFNDDILNMVASFMVEIISKHRKQGTIAQLTHAWHSFFMICFLSWIKSLCFLLSTVNAGLDTFLSKTAGLQLGQKPARVADKDMEGDLVKCLKDVGKVRPESWYPSFLWY